MLALIAFRGALFLQKLYNFLFEIKKKRKIYM
jgi:hypothetical protein